MDVSWIIPAFVMFDTLMEHLEHQSDPWAQVPDAEIATVAMVTAKYFANHHERAVQVMQGYVYLFWANQRLALQLLPACAERLARLHCRHCGRTVHTGGGLCD